MEEFVEHALNLVLKAKMQTNKEKADWGEKTNETKQTRTG